MRHAERSRAALRGWTFLPVTAFVILVLLSAFSHWPWRYFPRRAQTTPVGAMVLWEGTNKLDINAATQEELCQLPGIGEGLAEAVVQYRLENGPFSSVEAITNVKGIGEGTLEKIRDRICAVPLGG